MATSEEIQNRLRKLRTSLEALPEVSEPPKQTLRILGSMRAEQKWNTLLTYFIDPSQPHGFEADLLKSFLNKANEEADLGIEYYHRDFETVSIDTEITSPQNNRFDIAVRVPGEWFVWIESKVDASEGDRQTQRYVEDTHIGNEKKSEYPEDGRHYLFLSKKHAPDSRADGFEDIYWRHVVQTYNEELNLSHGQYPERSVSQLNDFLSTIIEVTNMKENDFEQIQKEKVRLLSEYRNDFDELLEAAETLRQRALEEWPELFLSELDDDLWTDEWHYRYEDYREYGCLFRDGWYLDNNELEPTIDHEETHGSTGFRLHFNHMIRRKKSFSKGKLTYRLRTPTSVELRDEFYNQYHSDKWQNELEPLLEERGITNIGNKKNHMRKTYDVDQSALPQSYFETLALAFEEHLPIAEVIDDIIADAVKNVKSK